MIEINLGKVERGTHEGKVTVKRGGKVFQRKQRLGTKEKDGDEGAKDDKKDEVKKPDTSGEYKIDFKNEEMIKAAVLGNIGDSSVTFNKDMPGTIKENQYEILSESIDYIGKYSEYLDGKSYLLLSKISDTLIKSAADGIGDVDASDFCVLMEDSIDDIVYQELNSWERQLGDHGIRHIFGNIDIMNGIFDSLNKVSPDTISPKDKFNGVFTMIYHDLGYTSERSRSSIAGTKFHKEDGSVLFDNNKEKFSKFTGDDHDTIKDYILRHDTPDIDWDKAPVLSAISVADNLALFYKEKLPKLFRDVPGSIDLLTNMQKALQSDDNEGFEENKNLLYDGIDKTGLPDYTKYMLKKAAKEVSPYTPKVTLSMLTGEVSNINFDKDKKLDIEINYNDYESELSKLYDQGQSKFVKLAESFGVDDFETDHFHFEKDGKPILSVYRKGKTTKIEINTGSLAEAIRLIREGRS